MKRSVFSIFLSLLVLLTLVSCGEKEETSLPESSIPSSEPEPEPVPSEPAEPEGEHTVTLQNGTGQDIIEMKIKSDAEEVWSYEILGSTIFASGTAIDLFLTDKEWLFADSWDLEITLADGTVHLYEDLPLLTDTVELTPIIPEADPNDP